MFLLSDLMAKPEPCWRAGAALEQPLSVGHPQEAWTLSASLEAASPCPSTCTCSLTLRGAGTRHPQSLPQVRAAGSHVAQWGLQPPPGATSAGRNCVSACSHSPLALSPPMESNISHRPFGEASYFLDDFAGAATVDPSAISVTAVCESSSNCSCTTHCPSGQP